MPIAAATDRAPSSSPSASAGDTAVTASARSPSTRCATAATSEESTPPEKATTAPSAVATTASSSPSDIARLPHRLGERLGPDLLHRPPRRRRDGGAVVVLRRHVDHPAVEQADLDPDRTTVDLDLLGPALQLVPVQRRDANPERARVLQERRGDGTLVARSGERAHHDARPALLHLDGGDPDIEGAGLRAALHRIRDQLRNQVVQVRLQQDDLRR